MTESPVSARSNRGPSAAAENRAALVEAARAEFAANGFGVPLSAVARRAGVGQGSLYRHFPDRIALALAVFGQNVEELEVLAADPSSSLDDLLDAITRQVLDSPAFVEMVHGVQEDGRVAELERRMTVVLETELSRARGSGSLAAWVTPEDVLLSVAMLGMVVGSSAPALREQTAARARAILRASLTGQPPAR